MKEHVSFVKMFCLYIAQEFFDFQLVFFKIIFLARKLSILANFSSKSLSFIDFLSKSAVFTNFLSFPSNPGTCPLWTHTVLVVNIKYLTFPTYIGNYTNMSSHPYFEFLPKCSIHDYKLLCVDFVRSSLNTQYAGVIRYSRKHWIL